eukprot:3582717-Amphidinium_carterae.1
MWNSQLQVGCCNFNIRCEVEDYSSLCLKVSMVPAFKEQRVAIVQRPLVSTVSTGTTKADF